MRRLLSSALFTCSSILVACSGDGFEMAPPSADTAIVDDAGEVPADANTAPEEDANHAEDANDAEDTADAADAMGADTTPSTDVADTQPVDTCTRNACGGCTRLDDAKLPGAKCGACGGGAFVCDGLDATKCSDPVTTAPGTVCGTCKTSTYVCAPDGKSTVCSKENDVNACGGCGRIDNLPGTACEACGVWTCTPDKGSMFCKAAAMPPGAMCGTCLRSKFTCTAPGVTACEQPDDRQLSSFGPGEVTVASEDVVSPRKSHGVELTAGKSGEITKLQLAILRRRYNCPSVMSLPHPDPACTCSWSPTFGRYLCIVNGAVTGKVTATIWAGYPGTLGASAKGSIAADNVVLSETATAWIEFVLASPLTVAAGQKIYVELSSDSTMYDFTWSRSPSASTTYDLVYSRVPGSETTWAATPNTTRPLKVFSKTCDY